MNIPANIPILNQPKNQAGEDLVEGITARRVDESRLEIPVGLNAEGKPMVAKVPEVHLAVQFRFLVKVPLAVNTSDEAQDLMKMVIQRGLQPEWDKTNACLQAMQERLQKAATNTVNMEHKARLAEGVQK